MGFGYLFLGYLVSFVISLTLKQLDVGGLAYLLGFALMLRGLLELERYQRAAEQGYPPAMYRLGLCLGAGRIVAQDPVAAKDWLTRARDKGVREAADALAILK